MRFKITAGFLLIFTLLTIQPIRAEGYTALVVGDSISAAYGLNEQDGWVFLAEQQLREKGHDVTFINASISGDTTAGGLRRLPDALQRFDPDLVIIELGGNDGLRGYPINAMQQNLEKMAVLSQDQGAEVLILGMMIPSNYGQAYLKMFAKAFADAAKATDSEFIPFLLEPIALDTNYFQSDGIHPNAEAQPLMADHVMPTMLEILEKSATSN
ncbi:MAG: arylesterase [Granulosicoccus sp.]|nr:arylesterase [Granulosicoccus sp.]